jgi:2-polyprenyl-3-methyl-5-hydroxy-6-metoxy-1,4-benzoquinol methylase
MSANELSRLQIIAKDSWYLKGVNSNMVRYSFEIFSRHIHGGRILEMGPAEGIMTPLLLQVSGSLTLLEGSKHFCDELGGRYPQVSVVHSLFEDYEPTEKYDYIILGHVLEHVEAPDSIVRKAAQWLNPGGKILAAVPNSRSIHRQAAVLMGLLPSEDFLNEMDIHHGHRRVFNPESFKEVFVQAGLCIKHLGGYWLKPISNAQIEEAWNPEMLKAFMQMGERYPDIAAEIYIIAELS